MNGDLCLVTGATGNVGREVVRALVANGVPVRAAARFPGAAAPGVEWTTLDFGCPASFGPALVGVSSLFLMRPPAIVMVARTLNRFIDAAVAARVRHCVFLSVAGAERMRLVPHRAVELHLMSSPLAWTLLRPGFFSQNFTGPYRPAILEGLLALPAGEARVAFVDAVDLGEAAASAVLGQERHSGKAYHLTGPAALGFGEATALLGRLLDREIAYRPVSGIEYWRGQVRRGASPLAAAVIAGIHIGLRNGSGATVDPALGGLIGRPARDLETFFRANLDAFRG